MRSAFVKAADIIAVELPHKSTALPTRRPRRRFSRNDQLRETGRRIVAEPTDVLNFGRLKPL